MVLGWFFTFQVCCHFVLLAPAALATILDQIFRPTLHLGVTFTLALLNMADFLTVLTLHTAFLPLPVSLFPFK
jgi:hypothetical protein